MTFRLDRLTGTGKMPYVVLQEWKKNMRGLQREQLCRQTSCPLNILLLTHDPEGHSEVDNGCDKEV